MPSLNGDRPTGPTYWRSLDHVADTPEFREFMHREFPKGASELLDGDRRHFLKVMGASMALAGLGLAGCRRWPKEHIMPFASRPEGRTPGVAEHFASCFEHEGLAAGIVVTSMDGRPIKIEGNPDHPASRGASDTFAQASILDLYDPDRSRAIRHDGKRATREEFAAWMSSDVAGSSGIAVLAGPNSSPTVQALRGRLEQAGATWHEWAACPNDNAFAASQASFGGAYMPMYDMGHADVIVSLDADFMGTDRAAMANIRGFADGRRRAPKNVEGSMNRLYSIESDLSLTGANADERAGVRPSDMALVVAHIAAGVMGSTPPSTPLPAGAETIVGHIVTDLKTAGAHGLVVAGEHLPVEAQVLAHAMNATLGAVGHTVKYVEAPGAIAQLASVSSLAAAIEAGTVSTLIILADDPVATAPADVDLAALIAKVDNSVYLGAYDDKTARACNWHVNSAHYLEAWGDGRWLDGTVSIAQPLILPFWNGVSTIECLAMALGETPDGMALVRSTFDRIAGGGDAAWQKALHDGVVPPKQPVATAPSVRMAGTAAAMAAIDQAGGSGWDVRFVLSPTLFDGRYANNGWLQELPDPITKLTWDNAVIISPAEAAAMGAGDGDMVTITVGSRSIEAPILRVPGIPARTVILQVGQGREIKGIDGQPARIATDAGFDFYSIRAADGLAMAAATVAKASGSYPLATTQDHFAIDVDTTGGKGVQQRLPQLFREADVAEYDSHPDFAKHRAHVVHRLSMWEETNYEGTYRWGLSIDLTSCVGCTSCVVACQAENNIPIVGKDQVLRGREMHWLRIDRYYRFEDDGHGHYDGADLRSVALQPVMCMMCENAPCEQVCPVAATVHDEDGLNVMVYNRCIGTRYCSNNCPYKVRRFNYFDYHRRDPHREKGLLQVDPSYYTEHSATPDETLQLQFNPEVSVRMRGVMEKCTYCTQRIAEARIKAKNEWAQESTEDKEATKEERIAIPDGSFTTACAQACAAGAITFGDLADPESKVLAEHRDPRSYQMLEELNVDARTRYIAKVRNPHGGGSHGDHSHDH